jgi:uncharacterized cupin superfamily protein
LSQDAAAPETDAPAPDRLIAGSPEFTTWNVEERDGLYCGIWRSTPGKWRIQYDEWEFCRILDGRSVLTNSDGQEHHVKAGDSFILRQGFPEPGKFWKPPPRNTSFVCKSAGVNRLRAASRQNSVAVV